MSQPSPSGKRILVIDGGAFRGLGCLLAIEAITNAAHKLCREPGSPPLRPCEIFDLICGSSTGGLLAILLSSLGLDCTTAIQEYKKLAQKLFGKDSYAFLDIVTSEKTQLDPRAYEDAIADLVFRHGGSQDLPFLRPKEDPGKNSQTGVMTKLKTSNHLKLSLSWKGSGHNWLVRDIIRQTTAAPIYVSPLQVQHKGNIETYVDAAYSGLLNPSVLAVMEAKRIWKSDKLGAIVSIGQWFSEVAVKAIKPDHYPASKEAKPFVPELLSNYSTKSGTDATALSIVKKVLEQATKTVAIDTRLSKTDGYYRVDPQLGIGKWELVDHFCPDLESNFMEWLASSEAKHLVDEIATKLVKPLPPKLVKPLPPKRVEQSPPTYQPAPAKFPEPVAQLKPEHTTSPDVPTPEQPKPPKPTHPALVWQSEVVGQLTPSNPIVTPLPVPATHTPIPTCEEPRPTTVTEYLQKFHIIFVIDDSTSMILTGPRWEEARDALRPMADYALQYKTDTLDLRFLNSPRVCKAVKDSAFIMEVFDQTRPPNLPRIQWTPTGACLQGILEEALDKLDAAIDNPSAYEQIKPLDIILLTDGIPSDDPKPVLEHAWARLQANKHHPNYIAVQIVQIGNDPTATLKLKDLMSSNVGGMVHTVPYDGVITPEKLHTILLGAAHPNARAPS